MAWDIRSYDPDPNNNTQINGIDISEGCSPAGINDAIRQIMGDIAASGVADAGRRADEASMAAAGAKETAEQALGNANNATSLAQSTVNDLDAHKADMAAHGATNAPEAGTIALRGAGGTLSVGEPTEAHHAATKEYVDAVAGSGGGGGGSDFFTGQITPYHGPMDATGAHPLVSGAARTDWRLCDGQNGTPDLRDRFILGAGGTRVAGNAGGAASAETSTVAAHTHTGGTIGATTLTIAQMPSHTHTIARASATSVPGKPQVSSGDGTSGSVTTAATGDGASHTHTNAATGGAGGHSHAVDIVPPYYALCYIMKL